MKRKILWVSWAHVRKRPRVQDQVSNRNFSTFELCGPGQKVDTEFSSSSEAFEEDPKFSQTLPESVRCSLHNTRSAQVAESRKDIVACEGWCVLYCNSTTGH